MSGPAKLQAPAALVDISESSPMQFENDSGKMISREVCRYIDIRDFRGTAVYPWLVMAANRHLSCPDLARVLDLASVESPSVYRPAKWLQKRKWMVLPPGAYISTNRPDRDGKQGKAIAIMAGNPELSLRDLTKLLKEHGIVRSREWVRRNRYNPNE